MRWDGIWVSWANKFDELDGFELRESIWRHLEKDFDGFNEI